VLAAQEQLVGTGHAEEEERSIGALGDVLDRVHEDGVRPLEVVDHQDERPATGQRLEQLLRRPVGVLGKRLLVGRLLLGG
jgi:hypothetical protein